MVIGMRHFRPVCALLAGLIATPALAQQFPLTLPPNSVYGRLDNAAGPGAAISFTTLSARLAAISPFGLAAGGVIAGTLQILPTAASAQRGLLITQSGPTTGTTAGTETNASAGSAALSYNQIYITGEGADVTGATSLKLTNGLNVAMLTGGANSTGTKVGQNVFLYKTSASAPAASRDHIVLNAYGIIAGGDGGTGLAVGDSKGSMFGAGIGVTAGAGATNLFEISGAEFNIGIETGASSTYRFGATFVGVGDIPAAGLDAAVEVGSSTVGGRWKTGLLFSSLHSTAPITTTGTVIGSNGSATVDSVIDFSSYTATNYFLRGPGSKFYVDGAGNAVAISGTFGAVAGPTSPFVVLGTTSGYVALGAPAVAGASVVTLPGATGTLATLAGSEEFTNKTLNASLGKGVWNASGTWTITNLASLTMSNSVTPQIVFVPLSGATKSAQFYQQADNWKIADAGVADRIIVPIATGAATFLAGTAIPAGGTDGAGVMFSTTANYGVFFGSGAPTLSAAKGSLYLRSDGTTTNDRAYINTNGSTTWTSLTTGSWLLRRDLYHDNDNTPVGLNMVG